MEWVKIFDKAFNLHQDPKPQIVVTYLWKSRLLSIETTKIGSWDLKHIGWVLPVIFAPQGKIEGRYKRLYIGRQLYLLQPSDLIGSLEIRPKLWIPDLTVRIYEAIGFEDPNQQMLKYLSIIEQKIDSLNQ